MVYVFKSFENVFGNLEKTIKVSKLSDTTLYIFFIFAEPCYSFATVVSLIEQSRSFICLHLYVRYVKEYFEYRINAT